MTTLTSCFPAAVIASSATNHVIRVILRCSEVKVVRIDAQSDIAMMKHPKSFWNWTVSKFPCGSMRPDESALRAHDEMGSVSLAVNGSSPKPTGVSALNVAFKSLTGRLRRMRVGTSSADTRTIGAFVPFTLKAEVFTALFAGGHMSIAYRTNGEHI